MFDGANGIELERIANIGGGQDGAIFNDYIFKLDERGNCRVYRLGEYSCICEFALDKTDVAVPHGNAVCFGKEYFSEDDEFPLMYTNIYNTYQNETDRREGQCLVYRILRSGEHFFSELVQIICIGFVNTSLWRSENANDIRPYGNFVIDVSSDILIAFVMRDSEHKTRFFKFKLPELSEGESGALGVRCVTLTEADIIECFDTAYMNFMQGACCHDGLVYSAEGFSDNKERTPCLRVIDIYKKSEVLNIDIMALGYPSEPEFVDVYANELYYCSGDGELFKVKFIV